jgi:hypothetical protein
MVFHNKVEEVGTLFLNARIELSIAAYALM